MNSNKTEEPRMKTVLVVDDEVEIREMLVRTFQRRGYHVIEADGGNAAMDILTRERVDLIISDVNMPDGDGVELLNRVRNASGLDLPILFITGAYTLTEEAALKRGAQGFFTKPLSFRKLAERVTALIGPGQSQDLPAADQVVQATG